MMGEGMGSEGAVFYFFQHCQNVEFSPQYALRVLEEDC